MNKRVVIVHGSYGSSKENWFPWLAGQVEALGHQAIVPDFPTPEDQSLSTWIDIFHSRVGILTPDTVLIGHSLGVAFILRLLERTRQPVTGAFLVSAFLGELGLPDFDKVNADFVLTPVDWPRVTANAGVVRVYNGDNDPYVPLAKGADIAKHLNTELTVIKGGGHINASAGFTTFPQLLTDLRQLCLG